MKPPPAGAAPRASAAFGATFMQEGKKYQFKYEYRQKYPVPAKFEYRMYGFTRTLKITVLSAAITVRSDRQGQPKNVGVAVKIESHAKVS